MMKELETLLINGVEYNYDPETEYIKDGHAYCKVCHEQKDGKVMDFLDRKWIFRNECNCDREKAKKEAERKKRMEIDSLKSSCFNSMSQWAYTFDNYQGEKEQCYTVAKNFVK